MHACVCVLNYTDIHTCGYKHTYVYYMYMYEYMLYSETRKRETPAWRRELYVQVLVVQICIANWLGFQFQFPGRC